MKESNMEYSNNIRFNKRISKIGFGAWQLGNSKDFSEMSEKDGLELVYKAVEKGITFFDTAPNYGGGMSEKILGKALEAKEDDIFINTKVGHDQQDRPDFSLKGITQSIQNSLKSLNRKKIDSVVLHNPGIKILKGKTEHYSHLDTLKKDGLINGFGVSIDTADELKLVLEHSDVDVIEIMFNIIHQSPKIWFDEVKKRNILLIAKVPLDSGWLTGKYNVNSTFTGIRSRWSKDDIQLRSEIIADIKDIVEEDDLVPAALSFILSYDAVTTVIPGTRTKKQLHSNINSLNYELKADKKRQLENLFKAKISNSQIPW